MVRRENPHMSRTRTARVRPNRCQISASISASDSGCSLRASRSRASSAASSPMRSQNTPSRHAGRHAGAAPQMYAAPVTLRGGLGIAWIAALVCAFAGSAHAQKKKKDGLFDMQWWQPPVKHEHDAAQRLAPQGLNLTPGVAPAAEARTIRLRIYADRDYRGTVIRWQSKARVQIQRINTVVSAVFNVHFEVESLRDWDRSHVGVPLGQPFIAELEALDDAKQVDLVVALVTPLRGVAASMHSIGYANYLSRHFILRG